jgi:hypothetical protein
LIALFVACVHPVDITVVGAEIAPTMADGRAWDGPDKVPEDLLARLTGTVGVAIDVTVELPEAVLRPDAGGTVTLFTGDGRNGEVRVLQEAADTTSPTWIGATFRRVRIDRDTRLHLVLSDRDLLSDEVIGTVDLDASDLARARRYGVIDTAGRTSGQLRVVRVTVTRAATDP